MRVVVLTDKISGKEKKSLKDVVSVNVSNYGSTPVSFMFNGHKRHVPAFDNSAMSTVADFHINANGHLFDCEIVFNQDNTNLLLDYTVQIEENNNKNCN